MTIHNLFRWLIGLKTMRDILGDGEQLKEDA
jgi:hypothetical protein